MFIIYKNKKLIAHRGKKKVLLFISGIELQSSINVLAVLIQIRWRVAKSHLVFTHSVHHARQDENDIHATVGTVGLDGILGL